MSVILLLTGSVTLYKDFVADHKLNFYFSRLDSKTIDKLITHYKVKNLLRYFISQGDSDPFHLTVAQYQDEAGNSRQAIVFPSNLKAQQPVLNTDELRFQIWNHAAQSIKEHVGQNAVFFTWWDNAQRLHLMTGRDSWAFTPILESYLQTSEQKLWLEIAGNFNLESQRLKQLADWLLMDATEGLQQIKAVLSPEQTAYFLFSLDDLARLQELSILAKRPIPIDSRVFHTTNNIHMLIAQVKSWAKEGGTGNYLVQPLPGIGVRAWRITDLKAKNLLFVRLLPFTHALEQPLDNISMVFRSEWGGYLTIFKMD